MNDKIENKKIPNVPHLRFKEFSGEWDKIELNKIADKVIKKNKDMAINETFTNSAEYGVISQKDFFDKSISNSENVDSYYVVAPNDFVYNPRISNLAPVGPINKNNLGRIGIMSPLYTVFAIKNANATFLEYYFKSTHWHYYMYTNGDNGARHDRFSISDKLFFKMPIPITVSEEQKKIADFLSLIDKKIDTQMKIIKETKSLIQNIKNKVIENSIFIKWIRIKDICTITTGKLDANAMKENGKYKFFTCSKDDYYIDEFAFDGEALIISGNGDLGLIKYYKGKFNAYQRTYILQNFKLSPIYVKFMMEYYLPRKIYKEKNIGAMPYIVLSTLAELEIPVVNNKIIEKMKQLYLFLNKRQNVDNTQLHNLKKLKHFLLNNMFI